MSEENSKLSFKDKIKSHLPLAGAFAAGSITTLVGIRYRNGIWPNERIWVAPIEGMRAAVAEGSPYILKTPKGEFFCKKITI